MSAEVGQIKGEIALELDADRLASTDFLRTVEAFIGLLREVTKVVDRDIPMDGWEVSVTPGSCIIDVFADAKRISDNQASSVASALLKEMRSQRGNKGDFFLGNDKIAGHIKTLARLATRERKGIPARVLTRKGSVEVTREMYDTVSGPLGYEVKNKVMGTVTGVLDVISVRKKREFRITERLRDRVIRCIADDTLMEEALRYFGKRVDVTGFISYDRKGLPEAVRAESIRPYPDPSEIPHFTKMRGILKEYS